MYGKYGTAIMMMAAALAQGDSCGYHKRSLPPVPANRGAGLKVCAKKFKHRNAKKRRKVC